MGGVKGQAILTQRAAELERESQALDAEADSPPSTRKTTASRRLWPSEGPSSYEKNSMPRRVVSGPLVELDRKGSHSDVSDDNPDKERIETIRDENATLRQQIGKLEGEKLDLMQQQRDLNTYVEM